MIHRVVLGSIERFIGIITEHYAGAFPVWLAPVQVRVLTITDRANEAAEKVAAALDAAGLRVEKDLRNEKIGKKIAEGRSQKIPYLLILGDKEAESGTVAVRSRGGDEGVMGSRRLHRARERGSPHKEKLKFDIINNCTPPNYEKRFGGVFMTKYGIKRACIAIAVLFAVNIAVITLAQRADAASYKRGSTGSVVSEIQQKLKDWGYYSAEVDGVYGSRTEAAVLLFQQKNGLAADGKAGAETLAALGISSAGLIEQNTSGDVALLARLISAEARGESYEGQVAVGAVVMNRIAHPSFPNTLSGVIYQRGAFSCLDDGQFDEPVAQSAYAAARDAMNGYDPTGGAIYYFNPVTATSKWIWSRPLIVQIGKHRFCA